MAPQEIRADYEQLAEIAKRFATHSDSTQQTTQQLRRNVARLQDSWQGQGAKAFLAEMDAEIFPAIIRLSDALTEAQSVTQNISKLLREAEEEAAALFKGGQSGGTSNGGSTADGGGDDGTAPNPSGPPFGDYNNLANEPPLRLGPGATHQDIAAVLEQMYRGKDGVDEPIRIVRVGENDYLVLIAGTDTGDQSTGSNDWWANTSTGRGIPSKYMEEVQARIMQDVPPGANIHLAGHSQGGHAAMAIAGDQDFVDKYNIGSVNTYGSSGNVPVNPRVGADRYHSFLLNGDPIGALQMHGQGNKFSTIVGAIAPPGSPLRGFLGDLGVAGINGPTIVPQVVMDPGSHGDYHHSPYLATQGVPFTIGRWDVVGSYQATNYDPGRVAADNISAAWNRGDYVGVAGGVVDMGFHLGTTTVVARAQNWSTGVTQYLPPSWQVAVDRQFDRIGHTVTNLPPPTQVISTGWNWLFGD